MRILIVDGLSHTRENLRAFLELQDGLEVVGEATSGREALQLSRRLTPDIVILDINLPDMDGLEAARQLTALSAKPSVFLLVLHLEDLNLSAAYSAGVLVCVEKSVGVEPILEAIRSQEKKIQDSDQT
jgi:DNA-binding NarL/FixJ family response regulator